LEIGSTAGKEIHGIRFAEAEVRSGADVGKALKVKLGMKKRLVSEGQSGSGKAGYTTGGNGLEKKEKGKGKRKKEKGERETKVKGRGFQVEEKEEV
jgi:hypothetical protein